MPVAVKKVRWKCPKCGKHLWVKPHKAKAMKFCSRACHYASMRVEKPVREKQSAKKTYGQRICEQCGDPYEARNKVQKFCSQSCSTANAQSRRRRDDVIPKPCEFCGKVFRPRPGSAGRFCSRPCNFAGQRGENAPNWKGGRHIDMYGYVKVSAPEHPSAHGNGDYVAEHRLVMEKHLGRYLTSGETIHHINGDRADNRLENLQLRKGKHGKGGVHRCADCGSTNIVTEEV